MRLGCAVGNRAYRWRQVSHVPWGARLKTAPTGGGMSVMRLGCAVGNRVYRWWRVSHAPGMRGWKPRLPVVASQSCPWDARLETAPTGGGGQAFASGLFSDVLPRSVIRAGRIWRSCPTELLRRRVIVRLRPLVFQFDNARFQFGVKPFQNLDSCRLDFQFGNARF